MMLDRNGYRKWNAYRKQLAAGVKEVGQRLAPNPRAIVVDRRSTSMHEETFEFKCAERVASARMDFTRGAWPVPCDDPIRTSGMTGALLGKP